MLCYSYQTHVVTALLAENIKAMLILKLNTNSLLNYRLELNIPLQIFMKRFFKYKFVSILGMKHKRKCADFT